MEKKIILSLRRCLLLAGTLALVSSCQDYEPFSDQQIQDVAYTHEFEKQFGKIDPNQNWDLFGQLARHIGPVTRAGGNQSPTITLLDSNADTLHISPEQHINYRLFLPELDIPSNTYENSNLGQVTQDFLTTARCIKLCPMHWTTSANDEIGIYWYVDEEEYDDQGNEITKTIMGQDEHMYYIKELPIITGTHKQRIDLETVDTNGNVSRTDLDGTFNIAAAFTPRNQWSQNNIRDQYLVSHPIQIDIPDNISEYGFWIRNTDGSGQRYSEWKLNNKIDGPIEADGTHRMSYTATFNINGLDLDGDGTKVWDPSQYLCFEDWMNYSDADLNDLVFIARGLDNTNIKDNNYITENALLVCEDLSKFDFDFNDVVLDLTYKEEDDRTYEWVEEKEVETPWGKKRIAAHWEVISSEAKTTWLYVTPMAAGGAYETDVYFGQLPATKGEIHALMQETGWNNNPLEHAIINAGATFQNIEGVQTIGEQISMGYVWNVGNGQGQYATHLSQLFAEGYIRLHCKRDDKDATKIITSGTIKTNKDQSTAPQMMLLPKFFEWPQEYVHITDAYTGFSDWVSDITKTSWILDTQVAEKVTDRGDLKPDNPQEAVDPTLIEGVSVPFHGGQFIYINPDDPTDTYTYNNGVFISLAGIQELLVSNDAKATVIVHFASKPANIYFDDANGNLLVYDKFGDDLQHTTYYTFSAKRFNQAVESGGMWLLQDEDRPLNVTAVEIEIIGATSPEKRHNLVVSPISMTFDEIGQTMAITATSSTGANFSYSSSDATVATVTMDNGVPTVHATGEGNCQILVTAVAGNGYNASVERITVVVDRTPTMPLTVGEPSWHADVVVDGNTRSYIYHCNLTTFADLSTWNNGATITFHYEGYDRNENQYATNFFRVLTSSEQVLAGDIYTWYYESERDVTYTITNLQSCYDQDTGEYIFVVEYTDWGFNRSPIITSASVTKIAN
jgi:hypothetical protein